MNSGFFQIYILSLYLLILILRLDVHNPSLHKILCQQKFCNVKTLKRSNFYTMWWSYRKEWSDFIHFRSWSNSNANITHYKCRKYDAVYTIPIEYFLEDSVLKMWCLTLEKVNRYRQYSPTDRIGDSICILQFSEKKKEISPQK